MVLVAPAGNLVIAAPVAVWIPVACIKAKGLLFLKAVPLVTVILVEVAVTFQPSLCKVA